MRKIDTASMTQELAKFSTYAPSKNPNRNAPCTVAELNNAIARATDLITIFISELEQAQ